MAGQLAHNLVQFARLLRGAGIAIGPQAVLDAHHALLAMGFGPRADVKACLRAAFVKDYDQIAIFDQAFDMFWRKRGLIEKLIAAMSPQVKAPAQKPTEPKAGARRVMEAFTPPRTAAQTQPSLEFDARFTASDIEHLQRKDFEQMSAQELAQAQKMLAQLRLPHDLMRTRRMLPSARHALIDPRASLRQMMRTQGQLLSFAYRAPRYVPPPLVAICDISGSMSDYTRMFLHLLHGLGAQGRVVHGFLFGTRLTNATRALRARDIDEALARCSQQVVDWNGGTRIGSSIADFNRLWGRRVLGQGAHVLLFTDGLERDGVDVLSHEMERLSKSCRRLIWLNPLLRYDKFEPKARGIQAILPYVDDFRAAHNIHAFADLIKALSVPVA